MSRAYQQRREVIDASIAHQGLTIAGEGSFGGSAVWMKAPETIDTAELAAQLRRSGVLIEPGAAFFDGPSPPTHYFRLAYSSIPSQRIADGIGLIAEAISQNSTSRQPLTESYCRPNTHSGRTAPAFTVWRNHPMKMTTEEAFVKTLQAHGIRHAFGIIGSAMMPISDIFPKAGITFWDCAHEMTAGMMADGYTRATGEMSMMIAQNGPGITNFVTSVKTATRLNPFSTLPGYGIDYWPTDAKVIQVDINPDRIGLTKKVTVGIVGDATKVANGITAAGRKYLAPGLFGPCGYGLPSIIGAKIGQQDVPVIGFAGDGAFGISVNELTAIGRDEWPAITQIVFRNYQWGAEKRNSTLWFDDNFVGTELDKKVSYAGIANACGLKGVQAKTMDELTAVLNEAIKDQMENNTTTLIEVILNQELGEPFRRDAMKKPVKVAGIDASDMAAE